VRPLEELVRPNIRTLKPYSTARDEFSGGEITTWLDANENPYDNGVNRYPDPHQKLLKQKIAALKGVREEQVFIGNGSDEAIDLCYRIFCRPGVDNAVSIAPTYGMYRVAADINDVEMREVPLGADFSLPADALLAAADERTRLLWLCSPNNPTGNAFPAKLFCYGYIQGNSQLSFVGNQPSRNVFAEDFDIRSFDHSFRAIQIQCILSVLFEFSYRFLRHFRYSSSHCLHLFAEFRA